jgi:hypothetical protein
MNLRNLTLGAFVAITAAFPIIARADCAYSTKYNLNMALGFLKDFAAYEREGGAVNDDLAAAALNNLRHELDVTDWNDVFECGHRAVSFYEALGVHASLGEARAEVHAAAGEDDPDNAKLDLSTIQMHVFDALEDLGTAYAYGYATYNLLDYQWLKQQVKAMAVQYRMKYKSPEQGVTPKPYAGPPNQWP